MKLSNKKQPIWYPLDNAAKIYPPTASAQRAHVFSFSAILSEEVDEYALKNAAENVLKHYPVFKTKLLKGKFWYYLEENDKPFKVFPEAPYYLKSIDYVRNNDYLFELLYIRNRVTIKIFHALTDGTGGFTFFVEILNEYFRILGRNIDLEGLIKPIDAPSSLDEQEDSFMIYQKPVKQKKEIVKRPFRLNGTKFAYDGCGMITAVVSVNGIKDLAKELGVTITAYLSALYMYSVYNAFLRDKPNRNKLINVLVPCNLRKRYGGETMRNFTMFTRVSNDFNEKVPSLEECAKIAQEQISNGLTTEKLDKIISDNVKIEKNVAIKIVPLFLKNLIMRLAYMKVGESLQTVDFSNLGLKKLPATLSKYIKHLTFAITPTFSCSHQTGVIGYGDNLYITFSRNFVETSIEKEFIRTLTSKGLMVKVFSNFWESQP